MVNRWFNPIEQFPDATGNALAGGLLFCATGVHQKQHLFRQSPHDPENEPYCARFQRARGGDLPAKFGIQSCLCPRHGYRPADFSHMDAGRFYTSDFSTVAQLPIRQRSPNANIAGTTGGSATIPASVAWDYVNDILYVCTTTGTSTTAVWTAVNPASGASATLPLLRKASWQQHYPNAGCKLRRYCNGCLLHALHGVARTSMAERFSV